jgi:hypothetical protein
VVKHLHSVPHSLTAPQKAGRVTRSKQLIDELFSIKHQGWQFILTLDESWFYFATEHEHIWFHPEEQPPERLIHMTQDCKMMVTIAWNPLGFQLLDSLPKGRTFNVDCYRDKILSVLFPLPPCADKRMFMIHAENASPHTSRKSTAFCADNALRLAAHSLHSPDLALN